MVSIRVPTGTVKDEVSLHLIEVRDDQEMFVAPNALTSKVAEGQVQLKKED